MDWITFTREEIDNDALPNVCMECGAPATCRVNETFSYTPEWVGWLFLAGVVPGIVASVLLERKMRVSCPFCARHGELWGGYPWKVRWGWLVALPCAGLGCLVGLAIGGSPAVVLSGLVGLAVGAAAWGIWAAFPFRRVEVRRITREEIHFQGLADAFVKAARKQREPAMPS